MNLNFTLYLGSKSPRRQQLLKEAEIPFTPRVIEIDESFPEEMEPTEVPGYLAQRKAAAHTDLKEGEVVLCSDTVVVAKGHILNKPEDADEAAAMLELLSGMDHEVITAFCLKSKSKELIISDTTRVFFKELSKEEIDHYVSTYKPFDKAGAYGIQEWIGMIAIEKIEGSYFTVMGLPVHKVYEALRTF